MVKTGRKLSNQMKVKKNQMKVKQKTSQTNYVNRDEKTTKRLND